jgi:WD40 repeat protein
MGTDVPEAATVLVVHVDADDKLARHALVEPLRAAGFRVFHGGDVLVGQSPSVEVGKLLEGGGLVVVCGTLRSAGSRAVRQYVRSARARSAGVRVFGVQMEPDADLEPLALDGKAALWGENREQVFIDLLADLRRHGLGGRGARVPAVSEPAHDFDQRVAQACLDRYPGGTILPRPARHDLPAFLDVRWRDEQGALLVWPVGLAPYGIDDDLFERFAAAIHATYERDDPRVVSEIVFGGDPVDEAFVNRSRRRGIRIWGLFEYERRWDPRRYLTHQAERLAGDRRYSPDLYVPQRFVRLDDHGDSPVPGGERDDLLGATLRWLETDAARLVVVLGDFGYGKSFLLRQLALRIPEKLPHLVPMLVELRDLDKINDLDVLLAQHLAKAGEDRIEVRAVRQMLARGQVALLFDGFDELALRITYDEAAEQLRTVLSAVTGHAKVVLTSRTQHFRSDDQWRTALGEQTHVVAGRREVRLVEFDVSQIRGFLANRVRLFGGNERDVDERLELIHDIQDLLGLSGNPRMLSFIAELPAEDLRAARDRTGKISSADLYKLLVDQWLDFEVHRRFALDRDGQHPHGTGGVYRTQLRVAMNALAVTLWETTEQGIDVARLERTAARTLSEWKQLRFDEAQAAHALGSRSLLVRNGDDSFGFIHSSVMEFLVAAQAAEPAHADLLDRREMSPLMADFFCSVAGGERASSWARVTARDSRASRTAKANALTVASILGVRLEGADLAGQDLRECDLTGRDLALADLTGADLAGARLRGTNLTHAKLAGADLSYATLDGVTLAGADLTGADFTGATVRGGSLHGARVAGSRWARAALVGTDADPVHRAGGPLSDVVWAHTEPAEPVVKPTMPEVRSLAFSSDGTWLAAADTDVVLVDMRAWRVVRVLTGHRGTVRSVAFDPAGTRVVSGGDDGTVRVWDAGTGRVLHTLTGHRGPVMSVGFDPAGARIVSGGDDGTARVWDAGTGRVLHTLTGHRGTIWSVGFDPAGTRLASGGADGTVRVWDAGTGRVLHTLTRHRRPVWSVGFDPAGTRVVSGGDDSTVRIWDAGTGRFLHTLTGHRGTVLSVGFDSAGTRLASGGYDGTVRVWDAGTGRVLHTLTGHRGAVLSVGFDSAGTRLASDGADGTVRVWDAGTGRVLHTLTGHRGSVSSVGFDPAGTRIVSGGADGTVRVWDAGTGRVLHTLTGHRGSAWSVGFDPAGGLLATADDEGTVRIWDAATGGQRHELTGHDGKVRSVAFDPAGARLAAGDDGTVRVWDAATGAPLATLLALPEGGWATLLPDGSYKLDGEPAGRFWWVVGQHRFEPGELDGFSPNVRRRTADEPLPGMPPV